jgi:3-oxoacyl-[acyl-carrier-protein] synthase-3
MSVHFANGSVKLLGSGSELPGKSIDNKSLYAGLEKQCGKEVARKAAIISRRLGIGSRHFCRDQDKAISAPTPNAPQLCIKAINKAQAESNIKNDIDYLIGHTTSPHTLLPPNISWVAEQLNHSGPYMELRQACTGFANALQIAIPMLANDAAMKSIAIVGSEVGSIYFDLSKDFVDTEQLVNYVQMGDGAGAVLLGQDNGSNEDIISDAYVGHIGNSKVPGFYLDGGGSDDVYCKSGLPVFRHNVTAVREQGAALFLKGVESILGRGYKLDDFAYILPHQVNGHLGRLLGERLNVPESRIIVDADKLGNLGSAAIWVSLDRLRRSGKLKRGDKVLVLGAEATKYLYGGFVFQH